MADDQQGQNLRAKMYGTMGRKQMITNMTNFRDIDNPFADNSLTLQSLKKEKHQAWKVRKEEKTLKLKYQIADMEKKLNIYRKYKGDLGVSLTKKERNKVLNHYNSTGVEFLMGRKMFTIRQMEAAVRIQSWWRRRKFRTWFNLILSMRSLAAMRIQKTWRTFQHLKVWPKMVKALKD